MKQLTFRELLSDSTYAAWLRKVPTVRAIGHTPAWRVYVRTDGRWARRDFEKYSQAYNWLLAKIKTDAVEDATIHSKRQGFKPPVVKLKSGKRTYWPTPPGHEWCIYCRRPTVYKYFSNHHNVPQWACTPYEKRCSICGFRKRSTKRYPSKVRSKWDAPD